MLETRWIRGSAALLLVGVLAAGVPLALVALAGNPLPEDWDAVVRAATMPDLGGAFLLGSVLPCIAWGAWAYLMTCFVVEGAIATRALFRPTSRRRPRGPGRRLASVLVSAIVMLIVGTGAVAPASAATVPATAASTVSATDAIVDAAPSVTAPWSQVGESSDPRSAGVDAADAGTMDAHADTDTTMRVTVREGDSLWGIAETYLGDGARYPEIAALNAGVPQPDGGVLDDDLWVNPGWVLTVPVEAATSDAQLAHRDDLDDIRADSERTGPTTPAATDDATVLVEPGDTLWGIAEKYLGDGARHDELIPPAGLRDPTLLQPGDTVIVPAASIAAPPESDGHDGHDGVDEDAPNEDAPEGDASDGAVDDAPSDDGDTSIPPTETSNPTATATPSTDPTVTPTPTPTSDATTAATPTPTPSATPSPTSAPSGIDTPGDSPVDGVAVSDGGPSASADAPSADADPVAFPVVGGIGATLAAGLLGWLTVRRLAQRRRRAPGERIAMPTPATPAARLETRLRSVDGTASALDLDHALRYLAAWAQESSAAMPTISVARVSADEIVLYLDTPTRLPDPFVTVADDGSAWSVDPAALSPLDRVPSAPFPALVSLGRDASESAVFLDLEHAGVLQVDGDDDVVRAAMLAMTLEIATSTWADDALVTLVGFDDALAAELSTGRVRFVTDIDALLRDLDAKRAEAERVLDELGTDSPRGARSIDPDADAWVSEIVLIGAPLRADLRDRLDDIATRLPTVGIAAVLCGDESDGSGWRLRVHDRTEGALVLPDSGGGLPLVPQLLDEGDYEQLLELARVTGLDAVQTIDAVDDATDWTVSLDPLGERESAAASEELESTAEPGAGLINAGDVLLPIDSLVEDATVQSAPTLVAAVDDELGERSGLAADDALREVLEELGPEIEAAATCLSAPPIARGAIARRRPGGSDAHDAEALDTAACELLASLETRPWVRLLGSVELLGTAGSAPVSPQTNAVNASAVGRATELVAYLALHPGVSAEQVHAAFWPGRDPRGKTAASNRNGLATKARKWLGASPEGESYFPHVGTGGYRLHDAVTTDWHVFLELVGDRLVEAPTPRLAAALDLVRGLPFAGVKERFYGWAEVTRMDMLATIADACHELARRALRDGDASTARVAAALGRQIDPINETSWRDALEAELLAGDHDGFERIAGLLQRQLDEFEDGYEPEPATQAIIDAGRLARRPITTPARHERAASADRAGAVS